MPITPSNQARIRGRFRRFTLVSRRAHKVLARVLTSGAYDKEDIELEGFFFLKNTSLAQQKITGDKIIALIKSVGDESAGSEWKLFKADPEAWLAAHYDFKFPPNHNSTGAPPRKPKLVPVYDTADTMHVRIPWKGALDGFSDNQIPVEQGYGRGPARLSVFMARYFMRKCR